MCGSRTYRRVWAAGVILGTMDLSVIQLVNNSLVGVSLLRERAKEKKRKGLQPNLPESLPFDPLAEWDTLARESGRRKIGEGGMAMRETDEE